MDDFKNIFADLPPWFLGSLLDKVTNGIFRWKTIKNLRCKGKISEECFKKISPRKILIKRDAFFEWAEDYVNSHK